MLSCMVLSRIGGYKENNWLRNEHSTVTLCTCGDRLIYRYNKLERKHALGLSWIMTMDLVRSPPHHCTLIFYSDATLISDLRVREYGPSFAAYRLGKYRSTSNLFWLMVSPSSAFIVLVRQSPHNCWALLSGVSSIRLYPSWNHTLHV